jgi:hypothetical protein
MMVDPSALRDRPRRQRGTIPDQCDRPIGRAGRGDAGRRNADQRRPGYGDRMVDFSGLVKSLQTPQGFSAPTELAYADIRARAISRADLEDDVRGINASIELIQRTRGGGWPTEPVTEEFNYVDLVWHELEFREGYSFAYAVYDAAGQYLGCCYLYPMGRRTALTPELVQHDVDVSWWVTPEAYDRGYYSKLYLALRHWVVDAYPFSNPYFSNAEVPEAD